MVLWGSGTWLCEGPGDESLKVQQKWRGCLQFPIFFRDVLIIRDITKLSQKVYVLLQDHGQIDNSFPHLSINCCFLQYFSRGSMTMCFLLLPPVEEPAIVLPVPRRTRWNWTEKDPMLFSLLHMLALVPLSSRGVLLLCNYSIISLKMNFFLIMLLGLLVNIYQSCIKVILCAI